MDLKKTLQSPHDGGSAWIRSKNVSILQRFSKKNSKCMGVLTKMLLLVSLLLLSLITLKLLLDKILIKEEIWISM